MSRPLACLAACLLFATAAGAADIAVLPVGLSLAGGHDRQAITVTNRGDEPAVMQVDAVSWTQADGRDRYEPTRDLLVNPPLFTVAPGQSQILRVGLRRPAPADREVAYRLFLREVPPAAPASSAGAGNGVRVLLELRLPVYVPPAEVVRAQQWRGRRTAGGGIELEMANTGNVHLVVGGLRLRDAAAPPAAPPLAEAGVSAAVFPGQQRRWELHPRQPLGGRHFVLEVATDRGRQDVDLELEQE